jgi:hypothetical protein
MLHIDDMQFQTLKKIYNTKQNFHEVFTIDDISQMAASKILTAQGLDICRLDDLGNQWSK